MPSTARSILDGISTSVAIKAPCRTVSTSNITLAGLQSFSSVTQVEGDRHLAKGQTDQAENGIYVASTGTWTRAKDFDGNRDVVQGTLVVVRGGAADGVIYEVTTANPIVIGTTDIVFELRDDPAITYAQTDEEVAATVTPTVDSYVVLNVLRYGADPTGVADSATAIQDAIDVAEQYANDGNGGGALVYLPTGKYRLLTGLVVSTANFIGMIGDGQFNSNLRPEGGITALTVRSRGLFADFGIVGESKTDGNTGIGCASCTQASFRSIRLRRLQDGAVMTDTFISRWYDPRFDGCANALVMVGTSDIGWGAGASACQDNKFFGGSWANNDYAMRLQGARNTIFYGPNIEANFYGFVLEGPAGYQNVVHGAWVESTHKVFYINTISTGSSARNNGFRSSYIALNGSATWVPPGGALDEARFLHVNAVGDGFRHTDISDNYVVVAGGGTTTVGVEVDSAVTAFQLCRAENNFWATALTYSGPQAAKPQGFTDSLFRRARAFVVRSSDQSIADDTETSIDWQVEDTDDGGWWDSGTPSQLVVPIGVRRVRVSAQVTWASDDVGYRRLKIQLNSSDNFLGRPELTLLPVSGVNTVMQVTGELDVSPGNLLRVRVYQNSTGSLNVQHDNAGRRTWFKIEAID